MAINVEQLIEEMLGAAGEALADRFEDAKDFAEAEFKKLAETLLMIERLSLEGKITEEEAKLHLRLQKNATLTVLLTIEGLGILAAEAAINAALDVVKETVNTALGFVLL